MIDTKKLVLFTVLNSQQPQSPVQIVRQLHAIWGIPEQDLRYAVWDMIAAGTLTVGEDLKLRAILTKEDDMPITDEDVQRVKEHVDKNSFYLTVDPNRTPCHPKDMVGKDLYVLAYERGEYQKKGKTKTYYRLKMIVREP